MPNTYVTIFIEGFIDLIGSSTLIKYYIYTYGNIVAYPLIQSGRFIDGYTTIISTNLSTNLYDSM